MKNRITVILLVLIVTSCVSPKVYKELESKYATLKQENRTLRDENGELLKTKNEAANDLAELQTKYDEAVKRRDQLESDYAVTKSKYDTLKASYDALDANSSSAIAANTQKNRELLAQLETKEQALATENARLAQLKKELESRSQRVADLESIIASKEAEMTALKNAISSALTDFEGKGLTVEQRNGKVYVSMENKLLFQSGSWAVGTQGRKAVKQLGTVLGDNPEISVLIEGHTDNAPYPAKGNISNNWDLSTKRATAIVSILQENGNIKADNLTAAGRGEFAPIAPNTTAEGKAKNRRIEVILTPKLDKITNLLNN
ncbi:OmpA family protein [Olleya sp. Bg11-27]|uniref:OmpA family protein n=1 Tax=Olleya sp. Bg11-27 TaxID=2058135 RepID=UPI000C315F30|nr:OmpA family protein [Olleya sp. Bg11-27]AUC74994.1 cell envelope biogenesis protein OmpA [Olleya sp. Bg11-27]